MAKAPTPWSRAQQLGFPTVPTIQLADADEEEDAAEPIPANYVWRAAYKWMGDGYDTAPGTAQVRLHLLHLPLLAALLSRALCRAWAYRQPSTTARGSAPKQVSSSCGGCGG
jgi:hypothetical protein